MHPILFTLFGVPFPAWHAFFALAAAATYGFAHLLLKCRGLQAELALFPRIFVTCYLSGWFGARALSILVEQLEVQSLNQFALELFRLGPMTFYGGFLLATLAGIAVAWPHRREVSLRRMADACFPAALVGLGVGRIGCFLNGDDYGRVAANGSWWALNFPNLNEDALRYATQLQEAGASFLIAGIGAWLWCRAPERLRPGQTACTVVLLSALNRFFNEFYRGDARGAFFGSELSTSQGVALLLCITASVLLFRFGTNPQESLR